MQFKVTNEDQRIVVAVEETRIDSAVAISFKDRLREIVVGARKPIAVDLHKVDFIDSSGLGAIIAVRKGLPDALPMVLLGLTPNVERVFRLTRMDMVFQIEPASGIAGAA